MIIDFHTHIFPDKIAQGALESLKDGIFKVEGISMTAHTDGTARGLNLSMKENGVDISVAMPIATKISQFDSINKFASESASKNIVSFGAFHPDIENVEDALLTLKNMGFKGIKLHPEFQRMYVDCPKAINIFKTAEKLKMYILIHAGCDIGFFPPVHCTPKRLKTLLNYVSGKYIIAAHMGGFRMWDEVEKHLVGTDIYFDTAFVKDYISKTQYKRIINSHGADKILFGSDSPWKMPKDTLKGLLSLSLLPEQLELITHKNAEKILSLNL